MNAMSVLAKSIRKKLNSLKPTYLEIQNESHMHSVPPNSETHFKVILVSEEFNGKSRIARHQVVNNTLAEELSGPVHALSIQAFTQYEWQKRDGYVAPSPNCRGKEKHS